MISGVNAAHPALQGGDRPAPAHARRFDTIMDYRVSTNDANGASSPRNTRALARKTKGSNNWAKARLRVAKVHARIADRRRDNLHKITTRPVRENQAVAIEDLPVRNMLRNHCSARAVPDAAWSELRVHAGVQERLARAGTPAHGPLVPRLGAVRGRPRVAARITTMT